MRTAGSIFGLVLAAAVGVACSHESNQSAGAQAPPMGQTQAAASSSACPLARLQGVHASVADIGDGVAITFTAPDSELDQLRDNVHAMADANDKQGDAFAACPCSRSSSGASMGAAEPMPSDKSGSSAYGGTSGYMTSMPSADAKVDEISTGAVLKLTAKDKSQVAALRSAVHQDVKLLKSACLGAGSTGQ